MARLLIIADDLTGASDVGVQFSRQGIPALVYTGLTPSLDAFADYQVIVVNTESRHLDPVEAATRVSYTVAQGIKSGATHFYKKTDSTLRGNIGSELESFMKATCCRTLPFIPAFPKLKRTTQNGFQYVLDKQLHVSAFAGDPLEPVTESFVPAILKKQTDLETTVVSKVEQSTVDAKQFAQEAIYIFDALTDSDLRAAAEAIQRNDLARVTAGSSGFAECLPTLISFEPQPVTRSDMGGAVLVINGSVNEVAFAQVAHARDRGFVSITLAPETLIAEDLNGSSGLEEMIIKIVALGERGKDVILTCSRSSSVPGQARDTAQTCTRIARNLGEITRRLLTRSAFKSLVVFGGDTLVGISKACGWSRLLPCEELVPGVVVSRIAGNSEAPLLISKAGGFGEVDVLSRVRNALKE